MPRSLRLRLQYIPRVKSSLLRNGFPSQKILAEDLGIAQSTVSHFLNGKPVDYVNFIEICRGLNQEWRDIADFDAESQHEEILPRVAKIAIARSNPNHRFVQQLHQALTATSHEVFLVGITDAVSETGFFYENTALQSADSVKNPVSLVGVRNSCLANNSSKSGSYLKNCDYLILLISAESAASEMILEQVQLAKELQNSTSHKPAILPICVELNAPVSFDLLNYLAGIHSWQWRCIGDSSQLISEILTVVLDESDRLFESPEIEAGIYSDHLRRHLWNLEKYAELMEAMREVVSVNQPVRLSSELGFKLNSMGLVKLDGNHCIPRCRLYERYFCDRLNDK